MGANNQNEHRERRIYCPLSSIQSLPRSSVNVKCKVQTFPSAIHHSSVVLCRYKKRATIGSTFRYGALSVHYAFTKFHRCHLPVVQIYVFTPPHQLLHLYVNCSDDWMSIPLRTDHGQHLFIAITWWRVISRMSQLFAIESQVVYVRCFT